ncbi:MAG TPA: SpoIIE family protein phosphatase, partial [Bryobacteraceae bacterium]|nr:SpoIIE family protein phosphatase [Bryobacteraceae bacterium]
LFAGIYETGFVKDLIRRMFHGSQAPAAPFVIETASRTIGSGPLRGDEILSLNGRPFSSARQFSDAIAQSRPGGRLRLVVSQPSGSAMETDVTIASETVSDYPAAANFAIVFCLYILVPFVCLGLGFAVAFIRPRDINAWLLLLLLMGFSGFTGSPDWHRSLPDISLAWQTFCAATWALWMMLFAIYFPARLELDRRRPWLKYLVIVPSVAGEALFWGIFWLWTRDINAASRWRGLLNWLYVYRIVFQMVGVGVFFAAFGFKWHTERAPDERRRLNILRIGASVSLFPTFLIVVNSLIRGRDVFAGVPWEIEVPALCMLALFPLTMAYVIVVERAMDLRVVVRQSVKYTLARGGLRFIRLLLLVAAVFVFTRPVGQGWRPVLVIAAVLGLLVIRRKNMDRASVWIDRKFFREAYNAELVLSELALEVGRYVEIEPLLETVARRISNTLHVEDIVIMVREGDRFRTRYSTRAGEPMDIAVGSHLLTLPRGQAEPLQVYLDKPQAWMRTLDTTELQTLAFMRSEVLLTLQGQTEIIGVMSLGAKKSGEPYSKSDLRLLQTIAVQMGMAVHNSRLASSLAAETAHREVMNRELEIAREVQQRLFPQKFPKIEGVDCFGFCRPARGVGGDYFDFIELNGGRIGIAIGDVSGKGVAAALLMASLQACLRGQTLAGVSDLGELMKNVNKLVYESSQSSRYATFFYGEFDPATRRFTYVNAGHNAPVILRKDEVIRLEASGPVVGLLPGVGYTMDACEMQPGDLFIGYTDGISEAQNEREEEWEEERFLAAARAAASRPARQVVEAIFREADAFTGNARQYDDMTLLTVKIAA